MVPSPYEIIRIIWGAKNKTKHICPGPSLALVYFLSTPRILMCSHNEVITCKWNLTFIYLWISVLSLPVPFSTFYLLPTPTVSCRFFFFFYLIWSFQFSLCRMLTETLYIFADCQINWFLSGSHSSIQTA